MIRFDLYSEDRDGDRAVYIDPSQVASVVETERRPAYSGWHQMAVIHLVTGKDYVVRDGSRKVAKSIESAKEGVQV